MPKSNTRDNHTASSPRINQESINIKIELLSYRLGLARALIQQLKLN